MLFEFELSVKGLDHTCQLIADIQDTRGRPTMGETMGIDDSVMSLSPSDCNRLRTNRLTWVVMILSP